MEKHLIIIDGYGFVFRAYYSMPSLTSPEGKPIGAIYGLTSMLIKLLAENHFSHITVALDTGGKSFRHDMYPEYKATRQVTPDDLIVQFPAVRQVIEAFAIKSVEMPGFEADDIIATMAKQAKAQGMKTTIFSSDKDLMQLIDDDITMFDPIKVKRIGKAEVIEKFGVEPKQVIDILSLMGDSSDNVPGVPGVGPKTATELLNKYHTLENVLANAMAISKPKLKESLTNNQELALLSKRLVSLADDLHLPCCLDDLIYHGIDPEKLCNFLDDNNFSSLKSRLKLPVQNKVNEPEIILIEISKAAELAGILQEIIHHGQLSISVSPNYLELLFADKYYKIHMIKEDTLFSAGVSIFDLKNFIEKLLAEQAVKKIVYDYKFLLKFFAVDPACNGIWVEDLMLMAYILGRPNMLGTLIEDYFPASEKTPIHYFDNIYQFMLQKLIADKLLGLYTGYDLPLVKVLYKMEEAGILVSRLGIVKLAETFGQEIEKLEKKIFAMAGQEFNIGSPKQLGEVLYNSMGMSTGKKTEKSKSLSTGAEALEELSASGNAIAGEILQWRRFSKLKSTYTDNLLNFADKAGRIHTCFLTNSTNTGRLSSIKPNLQNIPVRTSDGMKIRHNFIAPPGSKLISADYSQIELRILASLGQIDSLVQAFNEGVDIHTRTASDIFGLAPEQVTSEYRRMAKTINFGIIYGISPYGLSSRLGIDVGTAKKYIELYFIRYPGIKNYMEVTIEFAKKHGYVCTAAGRRCYMPGINDRNFSVRSFNERAAINAPLQGTQADIMKLAMINVYKYLEKEKLPVKMLLQIHDELLLEAPENIAAEVAGKVKEIMEKSAKLDIQAPVDTAVGDDWGSIS